MLYNNDQKVETGKTEILMVALIKGIQPEIKNLVTSHNCLIQ